MVLNRTCRAVAESGKQCRSASLRDDEFCFWHSPAHADEANEARRLGGLRRKRERTVAGAYEFDGLESLPAIRRLLEIATLDALSLDNSPARPRTLIAVALAGTKLLEVGDLVERVQAVEAAITPRAIDARRR